jgi:hypothetical protein
MFFMLEQKSHLEIKEVTLLAQHLYFLIDERKPSSGVKLDLLTIRCLAVHLLLRERFTTPSVYHPVPCGRKLYHN